LLLLLRIIGGQVRRNAIPRLSVIARAEQELRPDINRPLLVGTHMDRRVPVEAQLLFRIIRPGMDVAPLVRIAIYAPNLPALRLGVNIIRIGWVLKYPEAVASEYIFPVRIGYPTRKGRRRHPGTVVLQ